MRPIFGPPEVGFSRLADVGGLAAPLWSISIIGVFWPSLSVVAAGKFRRDTWKLAQAPHGWQGSCKRWDILSGSSRLSL
jgi:hypothetical protein